MRKKFFNTGFTLIELLVVISIIGILSSVLYLSFEDARSQARDKVRMTDLKTLQLAIETYKAQNGSYPVAGCSASATEFAGPGLASGSFESCSTYIIGLTPDFISVLPQDVKFENETNKGFYYRTDGVNYKLMIYDSIESLEIASWSDEFARCPKTGGECDGSSPSGANAKTYAVYSAGAISW